MSSCIFCKIASKEIKSDIFYEDEDVLAFLDIAPQAPVHIQVIPKKHIERIDELKDYSILPKIFRTINMLVEKKKLGQDGFRVVLNTGPNAGQAVYHIHFHLLGGRQFSWPPG